MNAVATLICDPSAPILNDALADGVQRALPTPATQSWLAPGIAVDLAFDAPALDHAAVDARLRDAIGDAPIDVVVQPAADRRKGLLVADMDSTMIAQECIDELAEVAGVGAHVAAITERAMRGEVAFEAALRERLALLRGVPVSAIGEIIRSRITLTPGARELVGTMRAAGAWTALVSGGFTLFTGPIAAMIGFDEHRSNELDVEGDSLAGTVRAPILGREAKRTSLIALRDRLTLSPAGTLAVGDGANDLDMLAEAGIGVAFRAKPVVAAAARARIDHADLTALLYLQGYRRTEFVGRA